jgi:hypothetical protein
MTLVTLSKHTSTREISKSGSAERNTKPPDASFRRWRYRPEALRGVINQHGLQYPPLRTAESSQFAAKKISALSTEKVYLAPECVAFSGDREGLHFVAA